jgi:hypothetical protein
VPTAKAILLLEPASLRKMLVVVAENTDVPLKVVLVPMRSISFLMEVNSLLSVVAWLVLRPPLEASVARVTARSSSVVICAKPPSAVCARPIPLLALALDCCRPRCWPATRWQSRVPPNRPRPC